MFNLLLGAVTLPFLLLLLDGLGLVSLPGFIVTVLAWTFGGGLAIGAVIFGPKFLEHLFGR